MAEDKQRDKIMRTLRRILDQPAEPGQEVEREILHEQVREALEAMEKGEPFSPALIARNYRQLREHVRYAEGKRAELQAEAEAGDPVAQDVLELLSDDRWWLARTEGD